MAGFQLSLARFPALRHRDYRLLLLGQLISMAGSQMQVAALHWHIYDLTGRPFDLGLVGLVRVIPIIGFSLLSGVVADAVDRRRLMLVTQTVLALLAGALAWLTLSGTVNLELILLISALGGMATAFDLPARQALVPRLVPREDLTNALSLYSTGAQVASIVGPLLAASVIALTRNLAWVYVLNALSFLAVIVALIALRADTAPAPGEVQRVSVQSALDGLRYVWESPMIRATMVLDFWATFFSSATALLPVITRDILHADVVVYGWLSAAAPLGAVVAGVIMSARKTVHRQGAVLLWAVVLYGVATIILGFSSWAWLSFLALAGTGATDTVSMVLRNTIRQLTTPDHLRGRMTSVNMIFFMGGPQLGEFEATTVAQALGTPFSVISGGIGCVLAVLWVLWREPEVKRYVGAA